MPTLTLGILTIYLNDRKQLEELPYYKKLILTGRSLGLDIFVFTPEDVYRRHRRIRALRYNPVNQTWYREWTDFPKLIFDRCRYQNSPRFQQLRQFRSAYPNLHYLNKPLANKWTIYKVLRRSERIRPFLPDTVIYQELQDLREMAEKYDTVFLKPKSGTGGRGILKISKNAGELYTMKGRDLQRRILPPRTGNLGSLVADLKGWKLPNRFLVQQGLDLTLRNGRVHDYRLLMQKNGSGKWGATGCAGRIGAAGSITSNLHGGGRAAKVDRLLREFVGDKAKGEQLKSEMERLGLDIVGELESRKYKLLELALDIAIDRNGDIWLLEINPKPSREVFRRLGEKAVYRQAVRKPLEYAMWAAQHRS